MSRRIKSLQLRLTVELAALFFVASCLAVGGLIYSASLTAGSLADRELGLRAEDLARYVSPDENRKPPALAAAAPEAGLFRGGPAIAVRDPGQGRAHCRGFHTRDRRHDRPMAASGCRTQLLPPQ
jgi:hypothetical protein